MASINTAIVLKLQNPFHEGQSLIEEKQPNTTATRGKI